MGSEMCIRDSVSGTGAGPPSQAGHDDLEGDGGMGFHTGPGSITGSSLYDLDTGHPSGKVNNISSQINSRLYIITVYNSSTA